MSTTTKNSVDAMEPRVLAEGYGPGAWHGPDLKAALADVNADLAFRRPGPGRHNIAEIALHHAYVVRNARAKLSGEEAGPFVLEGDDWFPLPDASRLSWQAILDLVEREHARLADTVAAIVEGRARSAVSESERFDLALGVTCHAVYHAGQVQLVKKLVAP